MIAPPFRILVLLGALLMASLVAGSGWAKDGGSGGGGGGGSSGSGGGSSSHGGSGGSGGGSGGSSDGGGSSRGGGTETSSRDEGSRGRGDDGGASGHGSWGDATQTGTDQDIARDAVLRGTAVPLARVLAVVRQSVGGDVLDVRLRRQGSLLVYDVTVLSAAGEYRSVVVDARRNRVIGSERR